jgi:uncharacterized membrane protein
MTWVIYAFITAILESFKDVLSKKKLAHVNEYVVAFALNIFPLFIFFPIVLFFSSWEIKNIPLFIQALIISGTLNAIAVLLYMKALKYHDLSQTIPMLSFTPLFLLISSPILLGEWPNFFGLIGVLLIVIGSYIFQIKHIKDGYFKPITMLFENRGSRFMLLVAFLWGISSNFDKIGMRQSSPLLWVFSFYLFISLILLPLVFYKTENFFRNFRSHFRDLGIIGAVNGAKLFFQVTAINLALVSYVISVKRTSILISVVLGHLIFKEKIKERFIGALVMFVGVLLMTLL